MTKAPAGAHRQLFPSKSANRVTWLLTHVIFHLDSGARFTTQKTPEGLNKQIASKDFKTKKTQDPYTDAEHFTLGLFKKRDIWECHQLSCALKLSSPEVGAVRTAKQFNREVLPASSAAMATQLEFKLVGLETHAFHSIYFWQAPKKQKKSNMNQLFSKPFFKKKHCFLFFNVFCWHLVALGSWCVALNGKTPLPKVPRRGP